MDIEIKDEPLPFEEHDCKPIVEEDGSLRFSEQNNHVFSDIYISTRPTRCKDKSIDSKEWLSSAVSPSLTEHGNPQPHPLQEFNFPLLETSCIKHEVEDEVETDPLHDPTFDQDSCVVNFSSHLVPFRHGDKRTGTLEQTVAVKYFDSRTSCTENTSVKDSVRQNSVISSCERQSVDSKLKGLKSVGIECSVSKESPRQRRCRPTPKLECNFCCSAFVHRLSLRRHKLSKHNGDSPYLCSKCDVRFVSEGELVRHEALHDHPRPYFCELCDARFTKKAELVIHRRYHTGDGCIVCRVCNVRFVTRQKYLVHRLTHTGERPYPCDDCNMTFKQRGHLKEHRHLKHGEGKVYQCDHCALKFSRTNHLNDHLLTHTGEKPYPCSQCEKCFTRRSHLLRHMSRHTGSRPFTCDTCQAGFARKDDLERHIRTHNGDRRYACSECTKTFVAGHHLKVHSRLHVPHGTRTWACKICNEEFAEKGRLFSHLHMHRTSAALLGHVSRVRQVNVPTEL